MAFVTSKVQVPTLHTCSSFTHCRKRRRKTGTSELCDGLLLAPQAAWPIRGSL